MLRKTPKKMHERRGITADDKEIGQRIRLRRSEIKMSQALLGEKLGVSFQQVQKYEKGVNRVGAARITQIANILEAPVDFFLGQNATEESKKMETLLFTDAPFATRLLKAWTEVPQAVQRHVVALLETMVAQKA